LQVHLIVLLKHFYFDSFYSVQQTWMRNRMSVYRTTLHLIATSGISGVRSTRLLATRYSTSTRTVKSLIRTALIVVRRSFFLWSYETVRFSLLSGFWIFYYDRLLQVNRTYSQSVAAHNGRCYCSTKHVSFMRRHRVGRNHSRQRSVTQLGYNMIFGPLSEHMFAMFLAIRVAFPMNISECM